MLIRVKCCQIDREKMLTWMVFDGQFSKGLLNLVV